MTDAHGQPSSVAERWRRELAEGGYAQSANTPARVRRLSRFSRSWRTIVTTCRLSPPASVLEVGCGGGAHLLPLALNGYRVVGIDCSAAVLARCRALIRQVEAVIARPLPIELVEGDFLAYATSAQYDLVFNFGVVEHFIDDAERRGAIDRMFAMCKPGGWVVSVVPSGAHPMRARVRAEGLGGYRVPEIDYTAELLEEEMRGAGACHVDVVPHNLFGYLLVDPDGAAVVKALRRALYYAGQLLPRSRGGFTSRHAYAFICAGRKAAATRGA
jgi:SAM-dependent methyltransferase